MVERLQGTITSLAKHELKLMFVAYPDACSACRSMQARVFDPVDAPPVPLKECLTPPCRCRYEVYDPRSVVSRLLSAGVDAVKQERLDEARDLLYQVIDLDERNEKAWLWLGGVVEGIDERIICLENVLAINPHHELARQGLHYLQTQRRDLGKGEETARKVKVARTAIDHIKAKQPEVLTLKEAPPVPTRPPRTMTVSPPPAIPQPVTEPVVRQVVPSPQQTVSFPIVFLSVLISVLLLILITAGLMSAASLLR